MNRTLKFIAAAVLAGTVIAVGSAQDKAPAPPEHKGTAETSLIGVSLYDSGTKLITKFGSPDEIQPLTIGASSTAAGGGASGAPSGGGRFGPSGAGAGQRGGGGGGGAATEAKQMIGDPFDTGMSNYQAVGGKIPAGAGPPGGGPSIGGGGGGAKMGGPSGGTTQGSASFVEFTRWVYNRGASKYAFVLDKFSRVVQIEAIGMMDSRVKTRRGVGFGTTFGNVIKKYSAPDGYEINGDNIVMRYLTRDRVAFRLQRLDPKKPQVVTGIVIAAGK